MSTQEWITFNEDVTDRFENAAWKCDGAWGTGQDAWNAMCEFASWFEDLVDDLITLLDSDECLRETELAALAAVTDILDLDYVDHDTHIRSLIQVRQYIEPGVTFYDWPYDISNLIDDDDNNDGIFEIEDV